MKGFVQIYTGDGKGKTTAAMGLALRAVGAGLRVYVGQFAKPGKSSEVKALQERFPGVTVEQYGTGGFVRGKPTTEQVRAAAQGCTQLRRALRSRAYNVVIADELCTAVAMKLVTLKTAKDLVRDRPDSVELVLTGGRAPQGLIKCADLVTEMKKVKHYYDRNVKARKGIEV